MSWVVSLVGCGGPAVSRCGHETRRHRVRGALFASVFASVLLAACGGGSGGNLTTSSEPEPGPPGPGLTATGGGDGQGSESENEQQQQKIIVNQEEEQQQEEEEESEEEEEQQQLTILEEEDFPYVPPEEEEPRYSAQTGGGNSVAKDDPHSIAKDGVLKEPKAIENCGSISANEAYDCAPATNKSSSLPGSVDYKLQNNWYSSSFVNLQGKDRDLEANLIGRTNNAAFRPSDANYNFAYKEDIDRLKKIEVTYTKQNGFIGLYSYEGSSGEITEDVTLKAAFYNKQVRETYVQGYIGGNDGITIEGTNFGQIRFYAEDENEDGQFIDKNVHFSSNKISSEIGFNELRGSFKSDGAGSFPTQVVGELKMKRFSERSNLSEFYKRGDNALAGVFVADKTSEVPINLVPLEAHLEGNIGMFSYGVWASDRPGDNRASLSIPMNREILYPLPPVKNIQITGLPAQQVRDSIELTYKKENGFRGAYIYKDQIGTIESDVHFNATYISNPSGRTNISIKGFVAKPFTMEGDDFEGIVLQGLTVVANDGSLPESTWTSGNNTIRFGTANFNATSGNVDSVDAQSNIQEQGTFSITVGATAGQEGSVSLKNYPEHMGGEVEVTGFSLDETENYADNTIVGVFVGDRKSGRNASTSTGTKIEWIE